MACSLGPSSCRVSRVLQESSASFASELAKTAEGDDESMTGKCRKSPPSPVFPVEVSSGDSRPPGRRVLHSPSRTRREATPFAGPPAPHRLTVNLLRTPTVIGAGSPPLTYFTAPHNNEWDGSWQRRCAAPGRPGTYRLAATDLPACQPTPTCPSRRVCVQASHGDDGAEENCDGDLI